MNITPFAPRFGAGVVVTPSSSSASSTVGLGNKCIAFTNTGANICYVRVGIGAQTATTADFPIPAGQQRIIYKGEDANTVAYISASGTTLQIIPGEGWGVI